MKAVKLFLKDHVTFLLFQGILVLFMHVLFWLDGFRNVNTVIYSVVISILLTFTFLAGKFIMRRSFYAAIIKTPTKPEDGLIRYAQGPEHVQIAANSRVLYKLYQREMQTLFTAQARQTEFMNHWVHQMKTPISILNLLLKEEEVDRTSMTEEINRIQAGLEIVLLNARLESFEQDLTIERVNLKHLVQQVVTDYKRLFITKGVFPVIEIDENMKVTTDVKWMKTVLGQFITNAIKYTFDTGKKIHFTASETIEGIAFSVVDEGVGIPSSDLNRVTKAFFTGENGRLTGESTGMGLYIAAKICKSLGHTMLIDSEVGKGTTVTIVFENGETKEASDSENNRFIERSNEDL